MGFNLNIPAKSFVVNNFCILWPTLFKTEINRGENMNMNMPVPSQRQPRYPHSLSQFTVPLFELAAQEAFPDFRHFEPL